MNQGKKKFSLDKYPPTVRIFIAFIPTFLMMAIRPYLPVAATYNPGAFFYPMVLLATWIGGSVAGLVSTIFCTIYIFFFLRPTLGAEVFSDNRASIRVVMFYVTFLLFLALVYILERALKKTKAALLLRDEFISTASHEMQTPMTGIKLNLEVLKHQLQDKGIELPEAMKTLERQARRQERLINSMLDLTLIDSGQLNLRKEYCDLKPIVEKASLYARDALNEGELRFTVSSVFGNWDRKRLDQITYNLVHNAVRYGDKKSVQISLISTGQIVELKVTNQGPVIPPEFHSMIFERFKRPVLGHQIQGMGVGLYLAKYLVELHEGKIRIESDEGKGTSFIVSLPIFHEPT